MEQGNNILDIDFIQTPAPQGLEITLENHQGFKMGADLIPGGTLAEAIAAVYVVCTGKRVIDSHAFANRLRATKLDVANRKISVIVSEE
jgi:hypothetical protein